LEHGFYDFPETVGNGMSSSQLLLTPSFFRGVGQPPTRWDWHCSTSNWMVGPCHVLRHWRWESTLSCCTSSVFPVLDQPRNLEMLVQLWPFISYNWLFLWDHTFYKWGFVSTYTWYRAITVDDDLDDDLEVSWNGGTSKSSILIRFSIINHPFWVPPFMETPI
jgi:hypothetical protein